MANYINTYKFNNLVCTECGSELTMKLTWSHAKNMKVFTVKCACEMVLVYEDGFVTVRSIKKYDKDYKR